MKRPEIIDFVKKNCPFCRRNHTVALMEIQKPIKDNPHDTYPSLRYRCQAAKKYFITENLKNHNVAIQGLYRGESVIKQRVKEEINRLSDIYSENENLQKENQDLKNEISSLKEELRETKKYLHEALEYGV